jgi:hypothetical protein
MIENNKAFYSVFLSGLALCIGLYAGEAVHFIRYGWHSADTDYWVSDLSKCRSVQGSETDLECPIPGYGWALYRYRDLEDKRRSPHVIYYVDRIK